MQKDELDATQQMFGDDFAELAHLFLSDTPKRLALLRSALTAKDAAESRRIAHVLCGSSASIGTSALAALCGDLEIKAKNNELEDALARLNTIEFEYARIEATLHDMLHVPFQTKVSNS
jgi:HPt (histidine-containing phosphotransfer) domain-containing protein